MGIRAVKTPSSTSSLIGYPLILIGIYPPIAVVIAVSAMSALWVVSNVYLMDLKKIVLEEAGADAAAKKKYLISTIKSFFPFRVHVGGLYYLDKEAKLTFMQFLGTALANMFLLT